MSRPATLSLLTLFTSGMLSVILSSCADLADDLDQFSDAVAEQNGSICLNRECTYYLYDENESEYVEGHYTSSVNGLDASEAELSWLREKKYSLSSGTSGTFFDNSPVTSSKYKFVVSCTEWQHPPKPQPEIYQPYSNNYQPAASPYQYIDQPTNHYNSPAQSPYQYNTGGYRPDSSTSAPGIR